MIKQLRIKLFATLLFASVATLALTGCPHHHHDDHHPPPPDHRDDHHDDHHDDDHR